MPRQNPNKMRKTALNFIEHGIENFSARHFSSFLFYKSFYDFQTFFFRVLFQFRKLRLQAQHLAVFLIGAFADVEKIFCWLWQCIHSFIFWRGLCSARERKIASIPRSGIFCAKNWNKNLFLYITSL